MPDYIYFGLAVLAAICWLIGYRFHLNFGRDVLEKTNSSASLKDAAEFTRSYRSVNFKSVSDAITKLVEAEAPREAQLAAAAEPADPEPEPFLEDMAEIRDTVDAIDAELERMPDAEAERRAEVEEAGINEPVMHGPQAEPELESAWQPGADGGHDEAAAEAEIEM